MTMAEALAAIGGVVTQAIAWVGDWMTCITGQPFILLFMLLPLVGLGVGFIKRLIRI